MRTMKRVSAFLGGAAALLVIGTSVLTAYAQETVDIDKDRAGEIKSGVTTVIADQVYAAPGEKVKFNVEIRGNAGTAGYAASGTTLEFDSKKLVMTPNPKKPEDKEDAWYQSGPGSADLSYSHSLNQDLGIWAFSTMGQDTCDQDGIYYTVEFTVPSDAKEGDTFNMDLSVDKWKNDKSQDLKFEAVDGWIKIRKKNEDTTTSSTTTSSTTSSSTTSSTTTSTTTDSTTSSTTTSSTTSSDTTSSTTTSSTDTTSSTTTSSTTPPTTTLTSPESSTTTTTTTTTLPNPENTTSITTATTPRGGGMQTTAANAVSTGDAGIGLAVTALLSAATAAIFMGKKKEN